MEALVRRLGAVLGSRCAAEQEVRWMQEYLQQLQPRVEPETSLQTMLRARVEQHQPLQYLLQTQPFCGLSLRTRPPVLIPRPETEEWTMLLAERINQFPRHPTGTHPRPLRILDLCCGSGAIGIGLLHLCKTRVTLHGLDISTEALQLARENAQQTLQAGNATFATFDLMMENHRASHALPAHDILVSNPPYISDQEYEHLSPDVRLWEDKRALVGTLPKGNHDGLAYYRRILHLLSLPKRSKPATWKRLVMHLPSSNKQLYRLPRIALEYGGNHQTEALLALYRPYFQHLEVLVDFAGKDRALFGFFDAEPCES